MEREKGESGFFLEGVNECDFQFRIFRSVFADFWYAFSYLFEREEQK